VLLSAGILGLAWFAAINAALSALSWLLSSLVADRVIPTVRRSRQLLALRLLPSVAAAITSFALFVPAHLELEPAQTDERYGMMLLVLAGAALLLLGRSACRLVSAASASRRFAAATGGNIASDRGPRCVELPLLQGIALAGVVRPRIVIGTGARRALTAAELDVAIAHELAHHRTLDNLTRLLLHCVPDFLGATAAARRLERLWDSQAECLADARAAAGDQERATRLASALLKVARLRTHEVPRSLAWSMFHQPALIEMRVRLLVDGGAEPAEQGHGAAKASAVAVAVIAGAWLAGVPTALHGLTERLLAWLP
jgi:hypothetical protein